jgi:hypothetical protein
LPLLRPVAIGLANRRETPEELAVEFRNVWGGVEVMGGPARDRLLAAELLNAASAEIDKIYAPMMTTTEAIRAAAGPNSAAVTSAALLHLLPSAGDPKAVARFREFRERLGNDEAAALLGGLSADPAPTARRFDALVQALSSAGATAGIDLTLCAAYLAAREGDPVHLVDRVTRLASLLPRLPHPLVAAALLAPIESLGDAELLDWLAKGTEIARRRHLAPTEAELTALSLGMVHGLPEAEFTNGGAPTGAPRNDTEAAAALLALHGWIYRPLVQVSRAATAAV